MSIGPDPHAPSQSNDELWTKAARNLGADSVVIGLSAAQIWGMPVPLRQRVDVAKVSVCKLEHGDLRARGRSVEGHRVVLPDEHVTRHRGLLATTPERTWLDCAALVREDHLLAMGDWALDQGLLNSVVLGDLLAWAVGRRGVRRARWVAPFIRTGVESPQESRLRWLLLSHGLPEPAINPTIVIRGESLARLDLAYHAFKLAIEYDGDWHAQTREHDHQRRERLIKAGWTVIVAYKEDLEYPERLVREVRRHVSEHGRRKARW